MVGARVAHFVSDDAGEQHVEDALVFGVMALFIVYGLLLLALQRLGPQRQHLSALIA